MIYERQRRALLNIWWQRDRTQTPRRPQETQDTGWSGEDAEVPQGAGKQEGPGSDTPGSSGRGAHRAAARCRHWGVGDSGNRKNLSVVGKKDGGIPGLPCCRRTKARPGLKFSWQFHACTGYGLTNVTERIRRPTNPRQEVSSTDFRMMRGRIPGSMAECYT